MIRNMVFDIGNVLMDFRWKEYMRSLFGEDETLIQTINQGIWHNGCWAAMDSFATVKGYIGLLELDLKNAQEKLNELRIQPK